MDEPAQQLASYQETRRQGIGEIAAAAQGNGIEGIRFSFRPVDNDGCIGHGKAPAQPDVRTEEPRPLHTCRTAGGGTELVSLVDVISAQRNVHPDVEAEERRLVPTPERFIIRKAAA